MSNLRASPLQQILSHFRADSQAREEQMHSKLKERQLAVQQTPKNPQAYLKLVRSHILLNQYPQALSVFEEGITQCPQASEIYSNYIAILKRCNRREEAVRVAERGLRELEGADAAALRIVKRLVLPVLYDTTEEINRYRRQFAAELLALCGETVLDTPADRANALAALKSWSNYYLAAQGENDRSLLCQYGQLLQRVMAANYPQWTAPVEMPRLERGEKLRVGYVSTFFLKNSLMKSHLGWLEEHDRKRIEVYSYHTGRTADTVTEDVERNSFRFRKAPELEEACEAVLKDRLHVLVYLDVGLHASFTCLMGAVRLAPVQCATWGNPVTTGLDTIDYYLSSSLMEPEDADEHYCERLVRLPGVGVCYPKPIIPPLASAKTRSDFGLREDAVVYLCCHSVHTFLPRYDRTFAEIAGRVPQSQFVFLASNELLEGDFRRRFERVFAAAGLRASDHCVMLGDLNPFEYWNLNLISDVYLDTVAWSGCNTTMEAIACDLPVVTMPGKFMRGRHSYAILMQLGVTDTIVQDEAGYVEAAVRLGTDKEWRESITARMRERKPQLYSDTQCVRALEEFYERAVREYQGRG